MKKYVYSFMLVCSTQAYAALNCLQECPITYTPNASNPLADFQERQSCMARCEEANSRQSEIEMQTMELQKQSELLEDIKKEQEDKLQEQEAALEEQEARLREQEDRINELEMEE